MRAKPRHWLTAHQAPCRPSSPPDSEQHPWGGHTCSILETLWGSCGDLPFFVRRGSVHRSFSRNKGISKCHAKISLSLNKIINPTVARKIFQLLSHKLVWLFETFFGVLWGEAYIFCEISIFTLQLSLTLLEMSSLWLRSMRWIVLGRTGVHGLDHGRQG